MIYEIKGKVIVLTGGNGGIGKLLSVNLQSFRGKVAALDINFERTEETGSFLPISCDITDEDQLTQAYERIIKKFNKIDILIHNAGITHMSRFTDTSRSTFDKIMDVNFHSSVHLTRICLQNIIENKGQIIAISSVAGFAPLYGRSAYSASKHALEGFFLSLGSELKEKDVSVSIVSPSFIRSRPELQAKVNDGISSPGATKKNTRGKEISPEEAVESILYTIQNRVPKLYLGRVSKIARWMFALFPNLYMKIMTRDARKEFEDIQM